MTTEEWDEREEIEGTAVIKVKDKGPQKLQV